MLAALLAAVVLRIRNAHYRQLCAEEQRDADHDGTPDFYQDEPTPDDTTETAGRMSRRA